MKKYGDFPVYFVIIGLLLNIIIYFCNKVSFIDLMLRSILIILLFSAVGYLIATVLENTAITVERNKKKEIKKINEEKSNSTIDIKVESDDEDELLLNFKKSEKEFQEFDMESFKKFKEQD